MNCGVILINYQGLAHLMLHLLASASTFMQEAQYGHSVMKIQFFLLFLKIFKLNLTLFLDKETLSSSLP